MKSTYNQAMTYVYSDEGGYSNDPGDSGGPTNFGITIHDARAYWKADATATDVKNMPKSVAADIYAKHYAALLRYDDLPAGVDYAVLDYGINSGISRSAKVLQRIVGVTPDGIIGPITLEAVSKVSSVDLINKIYDERLSFLRSLPIFSTFGKGWTNRCTRGRAHALAMVTPKTIQTRTSSFLSSLFSWVSVLVKFKQVKETINMNWITIFEAVMSALMTLSADSGKPWDQVIIDLINHLTPGKPNAPALAG